MNPRIKEAGELFDSLPESGKDMPKSEFVKKYCRLTDPKEFARDAKGMMDQGRMIKSKGINEKARIDRALNRRR